MRSIAQVLCKRTLISSQILYNGSIQRFCTAFLHNYLQKQVSGVTWAGGSRGYYVQYGEEYKQ